MRILARSDKQLARSQAGMTVEGVLRMHRRPGHTPVESTSGGCSASRWMACFALLGWSSGISPDLVARASEYDSADKFHLHAGARAAIGREDWEKMAKTAAITGTTAMTRLSSPPCEFGCDQLSPRPRPRAP